MKPKHISADAVEWIGMGPMQVGIVLTTEQTSGALSIIETRESPGTGIPTHIHTLEDETFFVLEGEFEFGVNDETIRATAGDVLFAPRNVPHSYRALTEGRLRVVITPGGMENMFREMSALPEGTTFEDTLKVSERYGMTFPKVEGET